MKILLVNYEQGHGVGPTRVQGYSGKTYGTAKFSAVYGCSVCVMSVADYNAAAKDLSKAWHLSRRRWVPIVAEEVTLTIAPEAPVTEAQATTEPTPEPETPQPETDQPAPSSEAELNKLPFFSLRKKAREMGINTTDLKGKEAVIAAILNIPA